MQVKKGHSRKEHYRHHARISTVGVIICFIAILLILIGMVVPLQDSIARISLDLEKKNTILIDTINQIVGLEFDIDYLQSQYDEVLGDLDATQHELDVAKQYEKRVDQGTKLSDAYELLLDIDKLEEQMSKITDIGYIYTSSKNPCNNNAWLLDIDTGFKRIC